MSPTHSNSSHWSVFKLEKKNINLVFPFITEWKQLISCQWNLHLVPYLNTIMIKYKLLGCVNCTKAVSFLHTRVCCNLLRSNLRVLGGGSGRQQVSGVTVMSWILGRHLRQATTIHVYLFLFISLVYREILDLQFNHWTKEWMCIRNVLNKV